MPFWSRKPKDSELSGEKDLSSSNDISTTSSPSMNTSQISTNNIIDKSSQSLQQTIPDQQSTSSAMVSDNAVVTQEAWTKIFPEAFGIRKLIEESSFRWCWRESTMWGIATGTVMYIHRRRMGSRNLFAGGIAYGTVLLVAAPSYYFCFRKREHQEHVIEMMMAANDFLPGEEMPESVPLDKEHPFLDVKDTSEESDNDRDLQKEFVARLKEKKEWQEPTPTQDADEVFKEVKKK